MPAMKGSRKGRKPMTSADPKARGPALDESDKGADQHGAALKGSQTAPDELPEQHLIRALAGLLTETGLTEIEIERAGLKVRVARQAAISAGVVAAAPERTANLAPAVAAGAQGATPAGTAGDVASHPGVVKSPMVGTVYTAAEPGTAPFIAVGDPVKQGQTLLIIEAMKTMNHIPAPKAGTVKEIFFENGQPVEYGEPLVIIE